MVDDYLFMRDFERIFWAGDAPAKAMHVLLRLLDYSYPTPNTRLSLVGYGYVSVPEIRCIIFIGCHTKYRNPKPDEMHSGTEPCSDPLHSVRHFYFVGEICHVTAWSWLTVKLLSIIWRQYVEHTKNRIFIYTVPSGPLRDSATSLRDVRFLFLDSKLVLFTNVCILLLVSPFELIKPLSVLSLRKINIIITLLISY